VASNAEFTGRTSEEEWMRIVLTIAFCIQLGVVAGCASKERVYDNIYEGLKARDAIIHPSVEHKLPEKSSSYHEYEAERKKLLENGDQQ
jgi:hypothetical protein